MSWRFWAAATLCLGALGAPTASAIEIQLPGEREMEVHGFYELRLEFLGEDIPGNGISLSQFRHVLNIETEVEIFPEGVGPFDFMMAFTRWIVSYDCVYQGGCVLPGIRNGTWPNSDRGLLHAMDSFGRDERELVRLPRNLKRAVNPPPWFGGVIPATRTVNLLRPDGTLRPARERLNPSRRFRGIINPPGVVANPNPFALFANLNARSQLDEPVRSFAGTIAKIRAGAYNPGFHLNYLSFARSSLGEDGFRTLQGIFTQNRLLKSGDVDANDLDVVAAGSLRALDAAIVREREGGASRERIDELKAQRDALLFELTPEAAERGEPCTSADVGCDLGNARIDFFTVSPTLQDLYEYQRTSELDALNLLVTRPDPNRFEILASATAPELLSALFGSTQLSHDIVLPYLATIDTPIRPLGYFNTGGAPLNMVSPYAVGVAQNADSIDTTTLPPLSPRASSGLQNDVVPAFFGPDGVLNTADDLPFPTAGLTITAPTPGTGWDEKAGALSAFTEVARVDGTRDLRLGGEAVVLYGRRDPRVVKAEGCKGLGGQSGLFGAPGEDFECRMPDPDQPGQFLDELFAQDELFALGCRNINSKNELGGINQDGDCIKLNVETGSVPGAGLHVSVVAGLGDQSLRPALADLEPSDLTDLVAVGRFGRPPPARPRSPGNQLFFQSAGLRKLRMESRHMVSALDLDFTEDELRWGHGASDDEHEFREGYLELEMFDGSLWARLGKLLVVWGKTELFRNQDRINPLDLSNGVITRLEEARVGQWGLDLVISPERWMRVGPINDLRLELLVLFDDFEPNDLGKCGEASALALVCLKAFGAYASGLAGLGVVGEVRPYHEYGGLKRWDFGMRIEGRWNRFTFAITDFWGWEDGSVIEVVNRYSRRVDPETGAPVNATGPLECKVRRAVDASGSVLVGPDGRPLPGGPDADFATTGDNLIPSVGNCLLFDNPSSATALQILRENDLIAASHTANQTIFHSLCTFTFDPDQGFCAFDRFNNPEQFELVGQAISGGDISTIALEGRRTIQLPDDKFAPEVASPFLDALLGPLSGNKRPAATEGVKVRPDQGALLGCGPAFASACGTFDQHNTFAGDEAAARAVGARDVLDFPGGLDFMNADGGVLTQDFTVLKAASQPFTSINPTDRAALVATRIPERGARGALRYESGVTLGRLTLAQIQGRDLVGTSRGFFPVPAELASQLTADNLARLGLLQRAELIARVNDEVFQLPGVVSAPTDGWVEPLPWALDEEALARGEVLYKIADQSQRDFRCIPNPGGVARLRDDAGVPIYEDHEIAYCEFRDAGWTRQNAGSRVILNDPTDPTNPQNEFIPNFDRIADVCHPFMLRTAAKLIGENPTFFERIDEFLAPGQDVATRQAVRLDEGCTELERLSANVERFLILLETVGNDRHFDPPESFDEIVAMLDSDFTNDDFGDPVSGRDGIFTRNNRVFSANHADVHTEAAQGSFNLINLADFDIEQGPEAESQFFADFVPADCTTTSCYLRVGSRSSPVEAGAVPQPLVAALPVSLQVTIDDPDASVFIPGVGEVSIDGFPTKISLLRLANLADLDGDGLGSAEGQLAVARLLAGETIKVSSRVRLPSGAIADSKAIGVKIEAGDRADLLGNRLSGDSVGFRELDLDQDGIWDGADDFTPGPVSDDNILCGSGLPGDVLQNGLQFDFWSDAEQDKAEQVFGEGLVDFPKRSPVYCRVTGGLLAATGQTLPIVRAGGDSTFGRRDFLWHGGAQLALTYQKRNVLGFALDFAEDVTKTSWGIELSWTANRLLGNTREFDGLSTHDEIVMSISIDRPTFFNFLNPNRSFFLNFQFFLRYLTDYEGGPDKRDGLFGSAERAFTSFFTFTFFTGYFQDRLGPRTTLVWDPTTQTGAVLWGLTYRWSGNFTTGLSASHFYGDPRSLQQAYFPVTLFPNREIFGEAALRGTAAVRNRDSFALNVRYSW